MPSARRRLLSSILLITTLVAGCNASSMSTLVRVACQRDSSLSFCKSDEPPPPSAVNAVPTANLRASGVTLSQNDRILLEDIALAVKRAGGNPFEKKRIARQGERKDSDLREKEKDNEEGFIEEEGEHTATPAETAHSEPVHLAETTTTTSPSPPSAPEDTEEKDQGFKGEKAEYCNNYEQHFSFYCVGDKSNDLSAEKFCKSYRKACPNKKATSGSGITAWPADPFENKPQTRVRTRQESTEVEQEDETTEQDLYYAELKRRFPCKPDCDQRLFPHCTAECKCDYIYPTVQRFCNPPPMPMFLNTCRLWYHGCPKYDAYHYASQFVYSKAEKGKVLPGFAQNGNPYGIPQPNPYAGGRPYRTEGAATELRPIAHGARTRAEEVLYVPPPLPPGYKEKLQRDRARTERIDVFEQVTRRRNRDRRRRRRLTARRRDAPATTKPPPTRKEVWRTLKALSALTADPARLTKDIIGQGAGGGGGGGEQRPRAQAPGFPVIPSDAAYGAGESDPFTKFNGLTDSRGILHRPRSSSPFTKPGLWAANPDDPHNRDHANKYYYHPESVGVDWLNGQLQWGAHWAVPAAQVGGTNGFSAVHFPTIGNFLNIPDDYD